MLPQDLLILVDSREKKPLLFPSHISCAHPTDPDQTVVYRLHTTTKELKAGDYGLAGYEGACLIERKGGAREVIQNCTTSDLPRWTASLDKLVAACSLPVLLLEGSPSDLLSSGNWCKDPHLAIDILLRMVAERRVPLEILPSATMHQRRVAGEWAARRLINGAIVHDRTL